MAKGAEYRDAEHAEGVRRAAAGREADSESLREAPCSPTARVGTRTPSYYGKCRKRKEVAKFAFFVMFRIGRRDLSGARRP